MYITTSTGVYKRGSVLTCTSDGFPDPVYTWTDASSGDVVASGRNITLASEVFRLRCTATANFGAPCDASLTIGNLQQSDRRRTTHPNKRKHSSGHCKKADIRPTSGRHKANFRQTLTLFNLEQVADLLCAQVNSASYP